MSGSLQLIRDALDALVPAALRPENLNSRHWTQAIKSAVCQIGKAQGYWVYASSCAEADGGEWLYDITWLNYRDDVFESVELVMESEWNWRGIDTDFQKLMLARAKSRCMVFEASNTLRGKQKVQDLVEQIQKFHDSRPGDTYLFCVWIADAATFYHEQYTQKVAPTIPPCGRLLLD